jgi:hypothetical protein
MAENMSKRLPGSEWGQYVEEARKYYDFDASQVAAAESLVRDYQARALVAVGGEEAWRAKLYQTGLWLGMALRLPGRGSDVARSLLFQDLAETRKPQKALGDELRDKIDEIATHAQREAAERRVLEALAAKGLDVDKRAAAGGQAAGSEESGR